MSYRKVGDELKTANSSPLFISAISTNAREETVYNFEVEGNHTYFVGEDGVLVHNEAQFYGSFDVSAGLKRLFGSKQNNPQKGAQDSASQNAKDAMLGASTLTGRRREGEEGDSENYFPEGLSDETRQNILSQAEKMNKLPYVWGGDGKNAVTLTKDYTFEEKDGVVNKVKTADGKKVSQSVIGADCTHYGTKLYNDAGVPAKYHTTADYYEGNAKDYVQISEKDLKPADKIIHRVEKINGGYSGHETIFIKKDAKGNNIVTQSTDTDKNNGVRVSGVDNSKTAYTINADSYKANTYEVKYFRYVGNRKK
ncbi:MAG: hypothetical protein L6Q54_13585 [Leptospiraceae bacterium]|nr:hypothetical protein [Leptospiraceae bacterium]